MKKYRVVIGNLLVAFLLSLLLGGGLPGQGTSPLANSTPGILLSHLYDSGFSLGDDNYNACFQASDGKIYYVLASGSADVGAQMYAFDPSTERIQHVGDLTEAAGEKGLHAIPQGKGHSLFVESHGKLYFASHVAYYSVSHEQEVIGTPPPGYKPYPGAHFLSYDLKTHQFENLAQAPEGEGFQTFSMDAERGRMYGITWPSGLFLRYDLPTHALKNFGPVSVGGEKGTPGTTFRVICRSIPVDREDGAAYFTTADGDIIRYRYDTDSLEKIQGCSLKRDVFGDINPAQPGTMGYNWRQVIWYPPEKVFYAVHGRSGYLFRFDPKAEKVEVLTRLVSNVTRASGMYDSFKYGYLGFTLGPDGHTIYYLTGTPPARSLPGGEQDQGIHLVTYDIPAQRMIDHGVLQLADGQRPFGTQAIAVARNGKIYTVAHVGRRRRESGTTSEKAQVPRVDLLSFPNPVHP
jgi:hypothetical protein